MTRRSLIRRRCELVGSRGQAIVEFVLVFPIMLLMFLAIVDLGRIYTTMMSVESAAREAADYGTTLGAGHWQPLVAPVTVEEMERRACVAASNLPDYVGPGTPCENPDFSYCVTPTVGGACGELNPADGCEEPTRPSPCTITVTLTYDFHLITPVRLDLMGMSIGFPSTITFQRDSTFAITDIDLSPSPSPSL